MFMTSNMETLIDGFQLNKLSALTRYQVTVRSFLGPHQATTPAFMGRAPILSAGRAYILFQ